MTDPKRKEGCFMNRIVDKTGLSSRRGVTIVEVVIALVVIAIVSASAVSLMMLSVDVEANFVTVTYAEISGENVWECFRFSGNHQTFLRALQKIAAFEYLEEENAYVYEGKNMTVTVKASFSPKELDYTAVKPNGEIIYSYSYPSEGGGS